MKAPRLFGDFWRNKRRRGVVCALVIGALLTIGCLPQSPAGSADQNITVYAFSVMKESIEKDVFPGFAAKWKREHGEEVRLTASFAGSETITNQILQGVGADVAILSIERDAQRLREGRAIFSDWRELPAQGIVNQSPFVILVRRGNPLGIRDFPDLAKPGVKLIHPDPVSSGGAQWSVLAIYGSELVKSERQTGKKDEARAMRTLRSVWRNVISTPGSAREARTQFEAGFGDAFITYELEGLLMKEAGAPVEIVVPEATIFSQHLAVIIDRNVTLAERPVVEAFMSYLWSDEAQHAFVKHHFRAADDESLNAANKKLSVIRLPFMIDYFGGWDRAYPEVVEKVWREQAQKGKAP